MKIYTLVLILMTFFQIFAQDKTAYVIFNEKGKKVSYKKLLKSVSTTSITFFGEFHNNPIAHWLEYELTTDLAKQTNHQITIGFEMFEQDQQQLLTDYLADKITTKTFEDSSRLWTNYKTDYKPIIEFAKENNIFCVASNIPRRLASIIYKKGRAALDSLEQVDYSYMCDKNYAVDTTLSQYQKMLNMMPDHNKGLNFIYSQASKDATMAKFIDKYWSSYPSTQFIHFNGAFHTDFDQGIIWYLKKYRPNLTYTTITTVEQADLKKLDEEHIGRAQFIICVNEKMTKTH
ncbi:MAG: ChaN family lipoprotein [Crocinitomicaceae bacterium]|nr:ChaN family lipoprotein [Crocinitomicaceae bacterium]